MPDRHRRGRVTVGEYPALADSTGYAIQRRCGPIPASADPRAPAAFASWIDAVRLRPMARPGNGKALSPVRDADTKPPLEEDSKESYSLGQRATGGRADFQ